MKILRRIPFFVVLLAIYPSLALLSTNIREVDALSVVRPLLLSLLAAGLLTVLLFRMYRNWVKACLLASLMLGLFFVYGHLVRFVRQYTAADRVVEIILYAVAVAVIFFCARAIARYRQSMESWVTGLNVASLVLVLFPLINIVTVLSQSGKGPAATTAPSVAATTNTAATQYPDIYYIILDGYSRADTLQELGYDNSEFLNSLKQDGFFIASCSRSNYRATLLSMSSIFNMNYLWDALPNKGADDSNSAPLYDALVHNAVRSELEQRGYTIVSFATGYRWDEWRDADHYLAPESDTVSDSLRSPNITPFEYIFLRNTALLPFLDKSNFTTTRFFPQYNRVNFVLEELPKVVALPGPKFVYAHIMVPHYPFIFLPDGSLNRDYRYYDTEESAPSDSELFARGYLNNVRFLDQRMPAIIQSILEQSKMPPIIVIQGDHGFVIPKRRYNNLNALYLPDGGDRALYSEITSVNTFRVIFNAYFGTNLELLKDASIDTDVGHPYKRRVLKPYPEACPN